MQKDNTVNQQQTFTTWVESYADDLYSWAFHKTNDKIIAQDLIQDTFLSAYKSIEKFRSESNPKTWLTSILNNKIIDHYRKKAKLININNPISNIEMEETNSFFDKYNSWDRNDFVENWEENEPLFSTVQFQEELIKCVENLKEKMRFVISAKYLLEKNSKEICQELDISPSNYWQILHRSKLLLKKCLESKNLRG